jgi:hypothetical protein
VLETIGSTLFRLLKWIATRMPGAFTFLFLTGAIGSWVKIGLGSWVAGLLLIVVLPAIGYGVGWLLSDAYRDYAIARLATCTLVNAATVVLIGYLAFA